MEKLYWNNNGKHQAINDALWEMLVPHSGEADTVQGEALRIISRIYYDYYNNGCCNLCYQNKWEEVNGSGEIEDYWNFKLERDIEKQIEFIYEYLDIDLKYNETPELVELIQNECSDYPSRKDSIRLGEKLEEFVNLIIEKIIKEIKLNLTKNV